MNEENVSWGDGTGPVMPAYGEALLDAIREGDLSTIHTLATDGSGELGVLADSVTRAGWRTMRDRMTSPAEGKRLWKMLRRWRPEDGNVAEVLRTWIRGVA